MRTSQLKKITSLTKQAFKRCIQEKDVECVVKKYHNKAILKGTFAKKTVSGPEEIAKYFDNLSKIVCDVNFEKDVIIFRREDMIFEYGNYIFVKNNGEKIKANYQFIFTPYRNDWKIFSHFSSLRWKDS